MDASTARLDRACSIGAGRMGRALLRAARSNGIEPVGVWSRSAGSRDAIDTELGLVPTSSLDELVGRAEVLFVAVADDAVAPVLDELATVARARQARPLVLVTSGAVRMDEQSAGARAALRLARLHPFQSVTFTSSADALDGVTAAITATDGAVLDDAFAIAARLGMRPFELADEHAATWHAAGALASGAVATLVAAARDLAVDVGVDPALALEAVTALALRTVERCAAESPERALTGPLVRGDAGTVAAHLTALEDRHPELVDAYGALAALTTSLATRAGRIDVAAATRIEQVLERARPGVPS